MPPLKVYGADKPLPAIAEAPNDPPFVSVNVLSFVDPFATVWPAGPETALRTLGLTTDEAPELEEGALLVECLGDHRVADHREQAARGDRRDQCDEADRRGLECDVAEHGRGRGIAEHQPAPAFLFAAQDEHGVRPWTIAGAAAR